MLTVLKIGGNILNDAPLLNQVLIDFSTLKGDKILVHGGGRTAQELSFKLGIEAKMHEGRRITNLETLEIVTMVYAGLLNKQIVVQLQANQCNAIGLSGVDGNVIQAKKREVKEIDFGFVGDLNENSINGLLIDSLLKQGLTPIFCAITHDKKGQLLNTNADTISASIAKEMAKTQKVRLIYCFEKKGVLTNIEDENSFLPKINASYYKELKKDNLIFEGMIPKLDNAFNAIEKGVFEVIICNPENIITLKEKTKLCL